MKNKNPKDKTLNSLSKDLLSLALIHERTNITTMYIGRMVEDLKLPENFELLSPGEAFRLGELNAENNFPLWFGWRTNISTIRARYKEVKRMQEVVSKRWQQKEKEDERKEQCS